MLVIDAVEGLTAQDAHVAGYALEEGTGLVVAVNKWDLLAEKTDRTFDQYIEWIRNEAPFLDFAPIISISAKTGQRVGRVLEAADRHLGGAPPPHPDGRAQPDAADRDRPDPAAAGPRPPAEALLRDAGRHRAADVRVLRLRCVGRPLQLPPIPREPAARDLRVRRHTDPPGLPRPRQGPGAAPAIHGEGRQGGQGQAPKAPASTKPGTAARRPSPGRTRRSH